MVVREVDFENGPNGTNVTNAHLGTGITVTGSGGPPTYSNTWAKTGTFSGYFNNVTSSNAVVCSLTGDRASIRGYVRFDARDTASISIASIWNASAAVAGLSIGPEGQFIVVDALGAGLGGSGSATVLTDGTVFRFALAAIRGTNTTDGTIRVYVAYGDAEPFWTFDSSAVNAGTTDIASARFGKTGGTGYVDARFDTITATNDHANLIGPHVVATPPVATLTDNQAIITASSGTPPYTIAQTTGPTTAPILVSTGVWRVPKHSTDSVAYRVTDSADQLSQAVTVPPVTGAEPFMFYDTGTEWVPVAP